MGYEAGADALGVLRPNLEVGAVTTAVGVDGAVEVGEGQAQRALRLQNPQELGQGRDQLRVGQLRQRVDADRVVDRVRVERQAAADVGDEVGPRLRLDVGVDPAGREMRPAAPVEARRPSGPPVLGLRTRIRLCSSLRSSDSDLLEQARQDLAGVEVLLGDLPRRLRVLARVRAHLFHGARGTVEVLERQQAAADGQALC